MALIIPSKSIFDVKHNKLLDNKIGGVQIVENNAKFKEITLEKTFDLWISEDTQIGDPQSPSGVLPDDFGYGEKLTYIKNATKYLTKEDIDVYQSVEEVITDLSFVIPNYIKPNSIKVSFEYKYSVVKVYDGYYYSISHKAVELSGNSIYTETLLASENEFASGKGESRFSFSIDNQNGYISITTGLEEVKSYVMSYNNHFVIDNADKDSIIPQKNIKINKPNVEVARNLPFIISTQDYVLEGDPQKKYFNPETQLCFVLNSVKMIVKALELDVSETVESVLGDGAANNVLKIEQNEFGSTYSIINEKSVLENLSNNILDKYTNGRETATIVCGMDYDYKVGDGKYSGSRIYENGMQVCPFVQSLPLSTTADRKAKNFIVANNKLTFDGEILQELTLIEDFESKTDFIENVAEFSEFDFGIEDKYYTGIFIAGGKYLFDADTGLNAPFDTKLVKVYTEYGEFVDSYLSPNIEKIITRSGNIGVIRNKSRVGDRYDNHYGWTIYWEKEPTQTPIYIDKLIYTL